MSKILLSAIEKELDTRDKRYMFLILEFPLVVKKVNLEGSSEYCAMMIYDEIKKHCLLESLQRVFELKFGYNFNKI